MKDSYPKKEAIKILERALNRKDQNIESDNELITSDDLEKMAIELHISKSELEKAASEISSIREQNRNEMYPEVVTTRIINGRYTDQEIENLCSDLRVEFGGTKTWNGSPVDIHKIGNTWEYQLKDATVLIKEIDNGYQLQVLKSQFFHGNSLEAGILAIPLAFILGLLPVTAAFEWVHLFAAIFTAAVLYYFSFSMIKKYTNKKRSEVVSKLLQITEYAEREMKKMANKKSIDLDTAVNQASENLDSPQKSNQDRLRSKS